MRCLSFPFRLFHAHAFLFLSFIMCVFVIVWMSLSLLHSFVVSFFGVFVCVDGMAAAVPFTSFVFVAAGIWVS